MAWTFTSVSTGLTGNGVVDFSTYYEAALIDLTTVPAWYGQTGDTGKRIYFGVGHVAVALASGPFYPRVRIQGRNQIVPAPIRSISRVAYWLPPGVIASVYYGVWA